MIFLGKSSGQDDFSPPNADLHLSPGLLSIPVSLLADHGTKLPCASQARRFGLYKATPIKALYIH